MATGFMLKWESHLKIMHFDNSLLLPVIIIINCSEEQSLILQKIQTLELPD